MKCKYCGTPGCKICNNCEGVIDGDRSVLMSMNPPELENVTFEELKWQCCVEGCERGTTVKDYSCSPFFMWRKRWLNLSNCLFYCGKHWQYFKRVPGKLKYKPGLGNEHLKNIQK